MDKFIGFIIRYSWAIFAVLMILVFLSYVSLSHYDYNCLAKEFCFSQDPNLNYSVYDVAKSEITCQSANNPCYWRKFDKINFTQLEAEYLKCKK